MNTGLTQHDTSEGALAYVIAHLRERDAREIFALRWDRDRATLFSEVRLMLNPLWQTWAVDGEPVAIIGACVLRPGVAMVACFGTDLWDRALPGMLRYARFVLPGLLARLDVHRYEAHALAANADTARFIAATGGELEATLSEYGREREDFLLYRWRVDAVLARWLGKERHDGIPVLPKV